MRFSASFGAEHRSSFFGFTLASGLCASDLRCLMPALAEQSQQPLVVGSA